MDRMLYIAMSGAKETMLSQAATSNNLANVSTTGFVADLQQFRSMPVFGEGQPTRVYAMSERPSTDFKPGSKMMTGRDLDVAVSGDGWFAVQGKDGNEAYTRRGDLQIDPNGLISTSNGLPLLGDGGPIAIPPADKVSIGSDGTISIVPKGGDPTQLAVVDRIKMVAAQYDEMEKGTDGLMRLKSGDIALADASQRLMQGFLESSNVNSVNEMVNMIELQRRFEMQVKMMKTADEMAEGSASLMRPGG
jgi:flagellar basal-body rod protein FlgF